MIDGKWKLTRGESDGQDIADQDLKGATLDVVGCRHVVRLADGTIEGTHTLDPESSPMSIDASDTVGPFANQTTLGIFDLDGDEFTVCFAAPDAKRPSEFTTKNGLATILHVWQRVPDEGA